ncbi:MAG TPA: glycosyltransferase family 2 protein [Fimbriimonadaceae bacterium]|nr:glycosyltransferase family 2 protein [Fimbriimonadaceae bacterium]
MPEQPDVTILVPALNEQDTIREVVERCLALPISKQVIVIDDGSDDRTTGILEEYRDRVLVLRNDLRTGKGSAIRQALPHATGKGVIIQDADLEYAPEQIPALIAPILKGEANVVYGTRFKSGFPKGMAFANRLVNRLLRGAVALLYFRRITDEATCYKAFERNLLLRMNLQCVRFEFCPEVTAKAIRLREKIVEIPIEYMPRTKAAGKKIRWTDAPEAFWTLLKHRFSRLP